MQKFKGCETPGALIFSPSQTISKEMLEKTKSYNIATLMAKLIVNHFVWVYHENIFSSYIIAITR